MTGYLEELGNKQCKKILYTDSQSFIQLVKNLSLSFKDETHKKTISFHS